MRTILLVGVMLLTVGTTFAIEKPTPPAAQTDDSEVLMNADGTPVLLTVGQARLSLWYKEQFDVLWQTAIRLEETAKDLEAQTTFLRVMAVVAASCVVVTTAGLVIVTIAKL